MNKHLDTIVICASGPSLTMEDCHEVMQTDAFVIAVNSTWQMVPSCQVIYAADVRWWNNHIALLPEGPERWTCDSYASRTWGLHHFEPPYRGSYNSGLRAMMFAVSLGAKNIILLGYDCSIRNGTHWHGDHVKSGNPTLPLLNVWQRDFQKLAEYLMGVNIFNCSRETALNCFPRYSLAQALYKCELKVWR